MVNEYNQLLKSSTYPSPTSQKENRITWRLLVAAGRYWAANELKRVEEKLKAWTKPTTERQIVGVASDLLRSKPELVAKNAYLRQQVIVLKRQITGKPQLTQKERRILVLLASKLKGWRDALHIVKPETLLKWHRQGFRLYWRQKTRRKGRKPRLEPETIALIKEMAVENRLWGAPRIRDELRKLGIKVSKRTVQKYMRQARRGLPPLNKSQTWATFLANHADEIWACDFVQIYDLFFRTIFIFFIIELGSRRVVHFNVTRSPGDAWVTQQLREATPFGVKPRFLICDNDGKYGSQFEALAENSGIDLIHTPVEAPKANAVCERYIGSVRRELLDHMLILSQRHLYHKVKEYVKYFNYARPHQEIEGHLPIPERTVPLVMPPISQLRRIPVLACLHPDYQWAA